MGTWAMMGAVEVVGRDQTLDMSAGRTDRRCLLGEWSCLLQKWRRPWEGQGVGDISSSVLDMANLRWPQDREIEKLSRTEYKFRGEAVE